MQLRQLIQLGITASVLAHVLLLGLIVLFSEVHPFGTVTAEPIAVDLVKPEEVPKPQDQKQDEKQPDNDRLLLQIPKDDFTAQASQAASPPPASPPAGQAMQQQQRTARPARQAAATAQPQPAQQQPAQQPAASPPPPTMPLAPRQQPAYTPPEPDVTVKYGVLLGLPEALPPASASSDKPGDGIDANASSAANISSSLLARFYEHLKTCSRLPATVTLSDNVFVKLRIVMTPQARLAAAPILIRASGSQEQKALDLKDSAVQALSACQPYDMLPADRYGEWKVLDLSFTPQDLG
jgi:hypothetical protein